MAYNDKVRDVEAPAVHVVSGGHGVGDTTPYKRHNMEGLEARLSALEARLGATDTATVATVAKTMAAVYPPDAHALV